jgi:predicted nucleotidyltransferase
MADRANRISRLNRLCEKRRVLLVYLFGSQKDTGLKYLHEHNIHHEQNIHIEKTSDLDIGILLESPPANMYRVHGDLYLNLSTIFDPFNIDIVFFHEVSYLLKFDIIKGHRIYAANEELADEYEENVMKFASDLSFKRKMFEKDFIEALENGYFEIELK